MPVGFALKIWDEDSIKENVNTALDVWDNADIPSDDSVVPQNPLAKSKLQETKEIALESGKGVLRAGENILAGLGATVKWIGETTTINPTLPEGLASKIGFKGPVWGKNLTQKIGEKIGKWGETAYDFWRKESQAGIEAPDPKTFQGSFMQNPSWTRAVATVAESVPSLAVATALTIATKNPVAGAGTLGLLEGSGQYVEAREAGKSIGKSSFMGSLSTIGNTLLEIIPLTRFLKGGSGKITKDIFVGAAQEGTEEVLQALWTNTIAKIGYDKTRSLTEGMVEGLIAGAGSGGLMGGITSGRGTDFDTEIKEAVEKGVAPEELEVMQEAVKNQIIDNAEKIDEVLENKAIETKEKIKKEDFVEEEPSKEIVAEKILRGEKLTEQEQNTYSDLQNINKQLAQLRGEVKQQPDEGKQKQIESLESQLGKKTGEKIKRSPTVKRILGLKNLVNTITAREDVLLRNQIRTEKKAFEGGYTAGKELIRRQESVKRQVTSTAQKLHNLTRFNLPAEYKEQIESELEGLGLLESTRPLKAKRSLSEFVNEQKQKGEFIPLSEEELAIADYTQFGNVTLDLLQKKYDTLKQVANIAQNQKKLLAFNEEAVFEDVMRDINKGIQQNTKARFKTQDKGLTPSGRKLSFIDKAKDSVDWIFAGLRKIEFISRTLDGQKEGIVQKQIVNKIQKGWTVEALENEQDYKSLANNFQNIQDRKSFFNEEIEVNYNDKIKVLTKEEMIGIYLNTLNEGNKYRLTNEKGWGLTEEQIKDAISRLNDNEIKFANLLQRIADKKWSKTADVKSKLTGKKMGKVQGYWPLVADKEIDKQSQLKQAEKDLFQTVMNRTFVEKGFTKERVGGQAPVELRAVRVFMNHINAVNHFNSHALAVRDIQKIINDPRFKESVSATMGERVYEQFAPYLRDVANPSKTITNAWEKAVGKLRMNSTAATLGLKFSVSLVQAGSFTQTIKELGFKNAVFGAFDFYFHPIKNAQTVQDLSPQLKFRDKTFDREVREWLESNEVRKVTEGKRSKTEVLYSMIRTVDKATTYPSWWAAYHTALKRNPDARSAISYADGVVRRTQPAGGIKDLASISRGNQFQRLFTMFYTHFSNYHNQMAAHMDYLKMSNDAGLKKIGNSLTAWWWLAIAPGIFAKFIKSGGREKDPWEYAKAVGSYAAGGIPLFRDMANAMLNQRFYGISSPAFGGLEEIEKTGAEFVRPVMGKEFRLEKAAEHGTKTIGYVFGLPSQQAWVTLDGIIDLMEGETEDIRRLILSKYQLGEDKKSGSLSDTLDAWNKPSKKTGKGITDALAAWND